MGPTSTQIRPGKLAENGFMGEKKEVGPQTKKRKVTVHLGKNITVPGLLKWGRYTEKDHQQGGGGNMEKKSKRHPQLGEGQEFGLIGQTKEKSKLFLSGGGAGIWSKETALRTLKSRPLDLGWGAPSRRWATLFWCWRDWKLKKLGGGGFGRKKKRKGKKKGKNLFPMPLGTKKKVGMKVHHQPLPICWSVG